MNDLKCFYTKDLKADGSPFVYKMINYTGIAGGIGPTGSIKSKNRSVKIPRSNKAQNIHTLAFVVKLIFFISLLFILSTNLISLSSTLMLVVFSIILLLSGGAIVRLIYKFTGVKSKMFHSSKYPLIEKLEKSGYSRGANVIISTTPLGTIAYIGRWLF